MYAMERQELIERLLLDEGRVRVVDLARRFEVTTETVRRDLDQLDRMGALRRVHGGAVVRDRESTVEPTLTERSHRRSEAKAAIARRALALVGDRFHGSLYLDAGTTTHAVAAQLEERLLVTGGQAEVVTHSMTLAHTLAGASESSLTVIGGRVRTATAAAVGADTVRAIERLRPDIAFLGTNGISSTFGASTPDPDEAAVKSAIVRAARRVVVLADAEKLGHDLLVSFASLDEIDVLVTDAAPDAELGAALADADVEVWVA
ncbi:DeoR/GlpR family DNA-binding transcription regulator [Microbacterium sp. zg.B48]|uniref:DeoR/GlpR family DNA-binding transcription regulator n=1 Tax=unclassified Microbacterium TaxID=2609290 RepID=UPI00214A9701|nr:MULTISPECIES: DeoR/GlpR family DNA-binding transcription regulator [unclassified Microbacterium]MCR2763609.1 DeoR/GlpR family DNA-binding transcription regulator [Microbacterium sp. zg.B48]MCR2809330.1 DeoR/GlpR family DNA-binding transcription regulator [Microbacterium sp. zg.B185]WIM20470.1 DeoR/GlpR family DNA-binding transcription regulator [Microbacterium sp. zg-B185]